MNRDDIILMAREAGWTGPEENVTYVAMLERFANLVAAAERERAAMICHQHRDWQDNPAEAIATAILGK